MKNASKKNEWVARETKQKADNMGEDRVVNCVEREWIGVEHIVWKHNFLYNKRK
jgi:hypothetical protein